MYNEVCVHNQHGPIVATPWLDKQFQSSPAHNVRQSDSLATTQYNVREPFAQLVAHIDQSSPAVLGWCC